MAEFPRSGLIKDSRNLLANYVSTAGIVQVGKGINSPYPTNYNNISPRAGFAWDILGSGKPLLRGGGGIICEQPSIRTFMFSGGGLNLNPSLWKDGAYSSCTTHLWQHGTQHLSWPILPGVGFLDFKNLEVWRAFPDAIGW
jgi:hypothetical protein